MLFNSFNYLIFFLVINLLFFSIPKQRRWILLLLASYIFYMFWEPVYAILIFTTTITVYLTALSISKFTDKKVKRKYLIVALLINLGVLFVFKYLNFFSFFLTSVFHWSGSEFDFPLIHVLLPVGISFYTFQALSYTLDVYHGRHPAETHFGKFALYVSYFPQLVAGPIERPGNLLPQLKNLEADFNYDRISAGLKLILWGFFKKVVVADNLSILVNEIYRQPENYAGFQLLVATILFGFQIYCDFSAYSDIAIGTARVMGVNLMQNFRTPFFSLSLSEFWQRWHISLSTWFRDYLFMPLAWRFSSHFKQEKYGLIRSEVLIYVSTVLVTFLLTGLWHGANWTFAVWGLLHAVYLIFEYISRKVRRKIRNKIGIAKKSGINSFFSWLLTFGFVTLSWVFFRAEHVGQAFSIVKQIFTKWSGFSFPVLDKGLYVLGGLFALVFMLVVEILMKNKEFDNLFLQRRRVFRWGFYYLILVMIVFFGYFGDVEFIYFQF